MSRKIIKRIKNDFIYIIIRAAIGSIRLVPRSVSIILGSALGRIAPYIARNEYNLAVEHLRIAFGSEKKEQDIRRLARETFRYLAMNFVDTARLIKINRKELHNISIPHNIERMKEAFNRGKGGILLTSHTGCWEIMGAYLTSIEIPIAAISRKLYDPRLERMIMETREHNGMENITRGSNTRDIIRTLKKGSILAILVDQDTKIKGTFVDFFGKPAYTATAPAQIALRYKIPIIPVFTYRDTDHNHHICVKEPIEPKTTDYNDSDVNELTAHISKVMESFIREHPEQWVWFHRRWKTKMKK